MQTVVCLACCVLWEADHAKGSMLISWPYSERNPGNLKLSMGKGLETLLRSWRCFAWKVGSYETLGLSLIYDKLSRERRVAFVLCYHLWLNLDQQRDAPGSRF